MKKLLTTCALCLMVSSMATREAKTCATLEMPGHFAEVSNEEAIIVWDAEKKIQHFIRRADFNASSPSVGFLVPTPDTPQLSEADNAAFEKIAQWMQPKIVHQTRKRYDFTPFIFGGARVQTVFNVANNALSTSDGAAVSVIERKRVAGYDAAVLAARDTKSLGRWLQQNKYVSSPALMTWLQPYVAKGWKVTAFKIARDDNRVDSGTVKMSFATPRPFFPYREPAKARQDGESPRTLRVYLVAKERMDGAIGNKVWPGRTTWTDSVSSPDSALFAKQLRLADDTSSTRLANMRVTTLEDRSSTRVAADDVYFQAAFDQSRIVPPPIIETKYQKVWIPADVVLLIFALLSATFYALIRRRAT